MRVLYDQNTHVAKFVAQLVPHCSRGFGACQTIGIIDDEGRLVAGLVYHNYDPEAQIIEISGASLPGKQWLTRGTIQAMYSYPFHGLGCQMIVQRTPASDTRLLGMLAAYDYHFIKIPRMFGRYRDGVLCCLTREAWAANRFNRRFKHHIKPVLEEAA